MSGGNPTSAEQRTFGNANLQTQLGQQQGALGPQYGQQGQQYLGQAAQLNQPSIGYYNAITGGNQQALLAAMGPQLGAVSQQAKQAQANIYNTVAPGAGRDYALASAEQGKGSQIASMINQAFTGALQGQQGLAAQALGAGFQQEGAGLSAFSGATNSLAASNQGYQNVMQTEVAKQQAKMQMLGDLAGAAGTALGGPLGGKLSDVRLKEEIEKIGQLGDVNLYRFLFKDTGEPSVGFLAQEVFTKHPEDVIVGGEDPKRDPWRVRYDTLLPKLVSGNGE